MCIECDAREVGITGDRDLSDIVRAWDEDHFPRLVEVASEQCETCGSVGLPRWRRSDGIGVCDSCWFELAPPKAERVRPLHRRTQPAQGHRAKHSYCFTCSTFHWNKLLDSCLRCGGLCAKLTEQQVELMERKPGAYEDKEDNNDGLADLARPAFLKAKNRAARAVAEKISAECKRTREAAALARAVSSNSEVQGAE